MSRNRSLVTAFAAVALFGACGGAPHGVPVRVIIPKGSTFKEATDSLERAKLVSWPRIFRLYGRFTGGDRNIKPGTYLLKHDTPWPDIVSALNGGKGLVNSITVPEGFSLRQIVPLMSRKLSVPADSVAAAVRDTALLSRLDLPNETLEGYLFPDTYAFPEGTTARQAVREMVQRFEREWKPAWDARLPELKINRNDLVTMASIVEKEAIRPEERPVIAAVYYNRLRKGMLLQADPTVQYALPQHVGRVLYRDLKVESPYNTYVHTGLPPGPIASPGAPSLAAAANPASVPYLFFVAAPDGHHEFRMTFAEHTAAIRKIRGIAAPIPPPSRPPPVKVAPAPAKRAAVRRTTTARKAPAKRPPPKTTATTRKKKPATR